MSYYYPSSTFSYVLRNKGEDAKESIAAATKRLLKTKQLLLVKRDKRYFYIQPFELRDSDVVQDQFQKEQSELQNNIAVNSLGELSHGNDTNNRPINSELELSSIKQSKQRNDIEK